MGLRTEKVVDFLGAASRDETLSAWFAACITFSVGPRRIEPKTT
jgi:hypothetical protein